MADTKINGALFQSMVTEGALAITEQKEQINELNVFPVPDGDTGTNMSMTMTAAMNELAKLSEPTLAKAADTTASALLRGARGNSGVILSLLLSLLMGLALVWLSIERTDKAYSIRQLRNEVEQRAVLKTKLEVERDRLLAPHVLRRKAIQLGMSEAKPGQIRRMPDPGPEAGVQ